MAKPKTAAQVEAEGTAPGLTWRGHDLTLPASIEDCDVEVLEAFEAGKATTFVRALLGAEQYQSLKPMTVADLADLGEHIARALGFITSGK